MKEREKSSHSETGNAFALRSWNGLDFFFGRGEAGGER